MSVLPATSISLKFIASFLIFISSSFNAVFFWNKESRKNKPKFKMTISFKTLYAIFALQLFVGGSIQTAIFLNGKLWSISQIFSRFLDNLRISGTSRYSTVYGLSNVSFCTLIMLMAFFVTDKEAKKFCERKFKLWKERMCVGKNQVHVLAPQRMNTGTSRRGIDANDIFVIDIV